MKNNRKYTWDGVEEAVNSIAMQMFKDEWRPDYIVGITRGGLVPAVLLSHTTDIPMKTLCVQLVSDGLEANTERNAIMAKHALKNIRKFLSLMISIEAVMHYNGFKMIGKMLWVSQVTTRQNNGIQM